MRITCKVCGSYLELNRIYIKVYCKDCENAYQRRYQKNYTPRIPQQKKIKCRAYAQKALEGGKLTRQPCERCCDLKTEMHHEDYDKPLEVNWLCRECHLDLHNERNSSKALEEDKCNIDASLMQVKNAKV
jgi:hypothetical protein